MSVYNKSGQLIGDVDVSYRALKVGMIPTKRPYWILHLDCGRKYFSVANIKSMIDAMHTNGLNQLQLHFAEANSGFRFALNNMVAIDTDGDPYDLSSCVATNRGGSLTESDMDQIIVYANSKGIDIVPSLDMPGHMTGIINHFPQFSYGGSKSTDDNWTLDCTNAKAVKFALAIVEKYALYFRSRGCKYWNIGADEVAEAASMGRWKNIDDVDIPKFVEFVNIVARYVSNIGMTPRAFNDGVLYKGDYGNLFDKNIEIYYWAQPSTLGETDRMQTASTLIANGYKMINTNMGYYMLVPNNNDQTSRPVLEANNLLKNFAGGSVAYDQCGACVCVWCDSDTTADGGDAALSAIIANINSFGIGIGLTLANIDYPVMEE